MTDRSIARTEGQSGYGSGHHHRHPTVSLIDPDRQEDHAHSQVNSPRGTMRRWCTNRNGTPTVPTTTASSTDGVRSWPAHGGHRIQHVAREYRFGRSPTRCPGSKTIADDRLVPEEGVLDSRLLMVACRLLPPLPSDALHRGDRVIASPRARSASGHPRRLGRRNHDGHTRLIDTHMELFPPARATASIFRSSPFALADSRQARAVDEEMQAGPAWNAPQRQGGFNREVRVLPLRAPRARSVRFPGGDGRRGQPDGDVASTDQGAIIGGPVPDVVLRLVRGMDSRLRPSSLVCPLETSQRFRAPTPAFDGFDSGPDGLNCPLQH